MSIVGSGPGPRTSAQILRDHLELAELSQRAGAKALKISDRLMRRYCAGEVEIPYQVLMAAKYLPKINRNDRVIALLDSGKLSTSDGDQTKAQFAAANRKLLQALEYLLERRDDLTA